MLSRMAPLFPHIVFHEHGTLDVGEGHSLHFACCGNSGMAEALVSAIRDLQR